MPFPDCNLRRLRADKAPAGYQVKKPSNNVSLRELVDYRLCGIPLGQKLLLKLSKETRHSLERADVETSVKAAEKLLTIIVLPYTRDGLCGMKIKQHI